MTRDEAIKIYRIFGCSRTEVHLREGLPQHVVDRAIYESTEDCIDGLIALGLLEVDQPLPSPVSSKDHP